jgi:hypothetical protein
MDQIILRLFAALLLTAPTVAHAEYCFNEKVTSLVVQGNSVWFTTNKSCPSWCGLSTGLSTDAYNRYYSLLLTSLTTGKLITTYWSQTAAGSNCPALPAYSLPDVIVIN